MSSYVLDASALLALVGRESGSQAVARAVGDGASISTVNLSEVVAKLAESGVPESTIRGALDPLGIEAVAFDSELAYRAGSLRPLTRRVGLSFGDRACLALAQQMGLPALTADRIWDSLQLGIVVQVIR